MFDIGFWELLLIAIVALIVVGPERLPRMIRVTGLWLGRANASLQSIRRDISRELHEEELKQALNEPIKFDESSILNPSSEPEKKTETDEVKDTNGN